MKLEAGKYYKTRGGRKAGPIKTFDEKFKGLVEGDTPNKGERVWHPDGLHAFNETVIDLVEEWTSMDIKIDGKYAYRQDPFTQVRILCIDRNNKELPVVSMSEVMGALNYHTSSGGYYKGVETPLDLVPLQEKAPDLWLNIYDYGLKVVHDSPQSAMLGKRKGDGTYTTEGVKTVKYIPAPDQTS